MAHLCTVWELFAAKFAVDTKYLEKYRPYRWNVSGTGALFSREAMLMVSRSENVNQVLNYGIFPALFVLSMLAFWWLPVAESTRAVLAFGLCAVGMFAMTIRLWRDAVKANSQDS